MMNLAAVEETLAIKDSVGGGMGGTSCPFSPADGELWLQRFLGSELVTVADFGVALPFLRDVRDTLLAGKMDKNHVSSVTAGSLGQCCHELEVLC